MMLDPKPDQDSQQGNVDQLIIQILHVLYIYINVIHIKLIFTNIFHTHHQ